MRKKKKILSMLLCMALCLTLLPTVTFAADERPAYSGGDGTKENPWLISSVEDLQTLQKTVNSGAAADIELMPTMEEKGLPEITTAIISSRPVTSTCRESKTGTRLAILEVIILLATMMAADIPSPA